MMWLGWLGLWLLVGLICAIITWYTEPAGDTDPDAYWNPWALLFILLCGGISAVIMLFSYGGEWCQTWWVENVKPIKIPARRIKSGEK